MSSIIKNFKGVYAIVDDVAHSSFGLSRLLHKITFESDIPVVQLRLKTMSPSEKFKWIETASQLKTFRDFCLIINDDVDALQLKSVDGVHLGQTDANFLGVRKKYPNKILGLSTHNFNEANQAQNLNADYIGCGAVFKTSTKTKTQHLELETLQKISKEIPIPNVAIGGITLKNFETVKETGASMIAVAKGLIADQKFVGQTLHERFIA